MSHSHTVTHRQSHHPQAEWHDRLADGAALSSDDDGLARGVVDLPSSSAVCQECSGATLAITESYHHSDNKNNNHNNNKNNKNNNDDKNDNNNNRTVITVTTVAMVRMLTTATMVAMVTK